MEFNIGSTVTFIRSNGEKAKGEIIGRNWCYDDLVSYIVRFDFCDIPVCAKTLKAQVL